MDADSYRHDPTLTEAMETLAKMEAEEAPKDSQTPEQQPDSATDQQRAAEPVAKAADSPSHDTKTDTPTTTEQQEPKDKPPEEKGSKYAKNQARLEGGWKALNERKDAIAKQEAAIKQREETISKREAQIRSREAQASKPKYSADQYDDAAGQWRKQAEALEADGKFDEADEARALAKQASSYAKHLRDNPPKPDPTEAELEAQFQAQQKEWWGKAAVDFPKVAQQDTAEAKALAALVKTEPEVISNPKGMYYAARLVTAETAAARVPAMEKELGELRARVQDLSSKLQISTEGTAIKPQGEVPFEQMTPEQQEAEVYRMAQEIDAKDGRP